MNIYRDLFGELTTEGGLIPLCDEHAEEYQDLVELAYFGPANGECTLCIAEEN